MNGRLLAVAAAAVAVFYGRAWRFDLQCDDFVHLRPWSAADLAGVWHGASDPQHAFAVFYRPLSSWFFAGTFELFGVHAVPHLLLSLLLLTAVVFGLARFVAGETGSTALGAVAAVVYAVHPNTPWSTGVWVTNDLHKLAALAVLAALLIWQRARHRAFAAWWPIALCALVAFLIKEDNLMLLPALLCAQWARARFVRDVSAPPLSVWIVGAAWCIAMWTGRWLALGQLGGFPWPTTLPSIARNLLRGPYYAFTFQGNESIGFTVGDFAIGAALIAITALAVTRATRQRQWLVVFAAILIAAYNAPLVLISNVTRYYIVTLGAVMVLTIAIDSLWAMAATAPRRAAAAIVFAAALILTGARQQQVLDQFAVCGHLPQACRGWMLEMLPTLPPEARADVSNMRGTCAAGERRHFDDADVLTWGVGDGASVDTMTGARARIGSAHVITLVRATATTARVQLRHPEATAAAPIDVAIEINGRPAAQWHLTSSDWVSADVALSRGWRTWLRGMHRADVVTTMSGAPRAGLEWQSIALPH